MQLTKSSAQGLQMLSRSSAIGYKYDETDMKSSQCRDLLSADLDAHETYF